MRLIVRVDEVLDLGHAELPHPQQTVPRCYLVAKAEAYLGSGERHALLIVVEQPPEVHKQPLSSLWPQVADSSSFGTNARLEHQVEWKWLGEIVLSRWGLGSVRQKVVVELLSIESVRLSLHMVSENTLRRLEVKSSELKSFVPLMIQVRT